MYWYKTDNRKEWSNPATLTTQKKKKKGKMLKVL